MQPKLRILWLYAARPALEYYEALQRHLREDGHTVEERQLPFPPTEALLTGYDVAVASFGLFHDERPGAKLPQLPAWERRTGSLCGRANSADSRLPLVALLNKEYAHLEAKLGWLRAHCLSAALTFHHNASNFAAATGVPFTRLSFAVEPHIFDGSGGEAAAAHFVQPTPGMTPGASAAHGKSDDGGWGGGRSDGGGGGSGGSRVAHNYSHDVGFSGTVRHDQAGNWRGVLWAQAFPQLRSRVRVWWGGAGSVHHGVAFKALEQGEYAAAMRSSKAWLSTTGPAQLARLPSRRRSKALVTVTPPRPGACGTTCG